MRRPEVALMLYTIREQCEADLPGALAMVREAGYEWVELAGLAGRDAQTFRRELDKAGLRACGAHQGIEELREPERVIETAEAIGYRRVVMPYTEQRGRDEFAALMHELEAASGSLGVHNIEVCYHNHDFEFVPFKDGGSMWELVEASGLLLELDLGWVWYAGHSPSEFLERHVGRTPLVHIKDVAARDEEPRFTPVGDGGVPWRDVFASGGLVEFAIVEQDELNGEPAGDMIGRSYRAVRTLLAEACVDQ